MKKFLIFLAFLTGCTSVHEVIIQKENKTLNNPVCSQLVKDFEARLSAASLALISEVDYVKDAKTEVGSWECMKEDRATITLIIEMDYTQETETKERGKCITRLHAKTSMPVLLGRTAEGKVDILDIGNATVEELSVVDKQCEK